MIFVNLRLREEKGQHSNEVVLGAIKRILIDLRKESNRE